MRTNQKIIEFWLVVGRKRHAPPSFFCQSPLSILPLRAPQFLITGTQSCLSVHGTFFFLLVEISKYKAMGLCASLHKSVGIEASCLCVRFAPFLSTAVVFRSADSCSEERSQGSGFRVKYIKGLKGPGGWVYKRQA